MINLINKIDFENSSKFLLYISLVLFIIGLLMYIYGTYLINKR